MSLRSVIDPAERNRRAPPRLGRWHTAALVFAHEQVAMQVQLVVKIALEGALAEHLFQASGESSGESHDVPSSAGLTNRSTTPAIRLQRLLSASICFSPRGVIA
jgi:hypothetical protein